MTILNERGTREYLRKHDAACPGCGYSMRGLRPGRCPECGREFAWEDVRAPEARISLRTAAVDLVGLFVTLGVNLALTGIVTLAVLIYGKSSWFTDPRFDLGGRFQYSISSGLLVVMATSLASWGWAWERSSPASWRAQNAMAVWCWLLTAFHAVAAVSLV